MAFKASMVVLREPLLDSTLLAVVEKAPPTDFAALCTDEADD